MGHMMAALVTEGWAVILDLPTFRLSRTAEGKPIRAPRRLAHVLSGSACHGGHGTER